MVDIIVVIPIKHWYWVGFNDGVKFYIHESLFGSIQEFGLVYM